MKLIDDLKSKLIKFWSEHKDRIDNSLYFVYDSISVPYFVFLESMAGNAQVIKLSLSQISKHSSGLEYFEEHLPEMVEFFKEIEPSVGKEISRDKTPLVEALEQHTKLFNTTQVNPFEMYLVYVVSIFEGFIQNIHYEVFTNYPETVRSNKTLSYKEILEFPDTASIAKYIAQCEASESTTGTPEEYLKRMAKRFGFDERVNLLLEPYSFIIDVRNLIVHNSGRVDQKFLSRNPKTDLKENDKIIINATNISELSENIRLYAEIIESTFTKKFPAISRIKWSSEIEGWLTSILELEVNKK